MEAIPGGRALRLRRMVRAVLSIGSLGFLDDRHVFTGVDADTRAHSTSAAIIPATPAAVEAFS
ncbi:hypothetical protein TREES_T100006329 [Tupaia chinensis]|uniref:Uncharacterized protein n=1 Tax=Tupaia chinensis TaxID=246437 RepID=L9L2H1_TUPCH|nr:hypothetical protein TREES_T100006329 [Tupaia chinensis]